MFPHQDVITETLQVDFSAPQRARSVVARHLEGHIALSDILLATSELVTNVVRHAEGVEEVELCLRRQDGTTRVSVCQSGDRFDRVRHLATDPHGRGLTIVESVSDRWGVELDGILQVWFEVDDDASPAQG